MSGFKDSLSRESLDFSAHTIHTDDEKSHTDDHTKDEFADIEHCISGMEAFAMGSVVVEKDIESCCTETDIEVADSNVTANDPDVVSETDYKSVDSNVTIKVAVITEDPDVKALDSSDITKAENAYCEKEKDMERNSHNPSPFADESICSQMDLNVDLYIKEFEDLIYERKTDFEVLESDFKSQLKPNTLLTPDDMDKAEVLGSNITTVDLDVASETYFKVEESSDINKAKDTSYEKKYFKVGSVDGSDDEDKSCGKNSDCTVKDPIDSKTNLAATKKGKVSFKIDSSIETKKVKEASTSKATDLKKGRLTPKMLNRMKTLLLKKYHSSGKDEFYIGDLIDAVEGELMDLPNKRKRLRSGQREERIKNLTKNKIRSINVQRHNIYHNMRVLSSSMNTEFKNLDEILLNLRQANDDFNTELNQPHTPIGEPNAASLRMDELFSKMKANLPLLQDSFKEVKHCLRLYVRADMTLTDNLHNVIQTYFADRLKGKHIPRVRYSEFLKTFMNSNRQHSHLDLESNAMDETSETSIGHDKI